MLKILQSDALAGLPVLALTPADGADCAACGGTASPEEAYRPAPQTSGNLQVDPDIVLPSPGMDVHIAQFYNSASTYNGPVGFGRTMSPNCLAQASGSPLVVTMTRGNGAVVTYQSLSGTGGPFTTVTPGAFSTIAYQSGTWLETTPQGVSSAYPADTTGRVTSLSYVQNAVGVRHTYSYNASGLLQNIQDGVGRLVTFTYGTGSLLQGIEDWAGRFTTFAYDTTTFPAQPTLTQITGPSGCQTQYAYDTAGLLTQITDPNGYATTYTYDAQRRVLTRAAAAAGVTNYAYGVGGAMTLQNSLGQTTSHFLDTATALIGAVADARGNVTTYLRNTKGQQTTLVDALGNLTTRAYDASGNATLLVDPLGRSTTVTVDSYSNPVRTLYPDGSIVTQVYGYAGSSFDTTGVKRRLQASVDQLGRRTTYAYNAFGQQTSVTDPLGHITTTGYDAFGNLTSVKDPLGRITSYGYDSGGNRARVLNALGYRTTSTYDPQNRVTSQQDQLGRITTYGYDSGGNNTIVIDALGNRTTTTYNVFDQPIGTMDALGHVTTRLYDTLGRVTGSMDALGNITTTVYDVAGNVAQSENPLGFTTVTVYDAANRPVASVDPLGNVTTTVYDASSNAVAMIDPLGHRTTSVYDTLNRVVARVDGNGHAASTVYALTGSVVANVDPLGHRTTNVYDAAIQIVAMIDPLGRFTTTSYDATGNAVKSVDALGYATTMTYDVLNRRTASVDPLGHASTTIYDAAGNVTASIDPLGYRTTMVYDALNRPTASINARSYITTTTYNAVSLPIRTTSALGYVRTMTYDATNRRVSSADPIGAVSTTVYDAASRMVAQMDPLGHATTYGYDAAGRNTSVMNPRGFMTTTVYDAASNQISATDANGNRTQYLYDAANQMTSVQDAAGGISQIGYDAAGRQVTETNPLNYVTTYVYDAASNQISATDANAHVTTTAYDALNRALAMQDPLGDWTTFSFDAAGRQKSVVNAVGQRTTMSYDARSLFTSQRDSRGLLTTYTYDQMANRTLSLDQRGVAITYSYDALDRQSGKLYPDGSRVTFGYDPADRMTTMRDAPTGLTTYAYDLAGRLTGYVPGLSRVALSYSYDPAGNRLSLTETAAGRSVTYSYDPAGNLSQIVNSYGDTTVFTYDKLNRETVRQRAGDLTISYTYDPASQLAQLWTKQYQPQMGQPPVTFSYDPAGNRTNVNLDSPIGFGTGGRTYTYDAADQVSSEIFSSSGMNALGYISTYAYDPVGNWPTRQEFINGTSVNLFLYQTTFTHDTGNELTGWSSSWVNLTLSGSGASAATYTYDAAGNRLTADIDGQVTTYLWDYEGRLAGITYAPGATLTSGVLTNLYSADGLRQGYIDHTGLTTLTYDIGSQNLYRRDVQGTADTERYTHRPEDYGDVISVCRTASATGGIVTNLFYSTIDGTRSISSLAAVGDDVTLGNFVLWPAFGGGSRSVPSVPATLASQPFQYQGGWGYYTDPTSGLIYVKARWYDPVNGVWLSRDPIGFNGGDWSNLYRYVGNAPIVRGDPSGNISVKPVGLGSWWIGSNPQACGVARAFWDFTLSKPAPCDGWFVQYVEHSGSAYDCGHTKEPAVADYWEAWQVIKTDRIWILRHHYTQFTDEFNRPYYRKPPSNQYIPDQGHYKIVGTVKFFCDPVRKPLGIDRAHGWIKTNPNAGILWSTYTRPPWWGRPSLDPIGKHQMTVDWCCCGPKADYFTVSKADPH